MNELSIYRDRVERRFSYLANQILKPFEEVPIYTIDRRDGGKTLCFHPHMIDSMQVDIIGMSRLIFTNACSAEYSYHDIPSTKIELHRHILPPGASGLPQGLPLPDATHLLDTSLACFGTAAMMKMAWDDMRFEAMEYIDFTTRFHHWTNNLEGTVWDLLDYSHSLVEGLSGCIRQSFYDDPRDVHGRRVYTNGSYHTEFSPFIPVRTNLADIFHIIDRPYTLSHAQAANLFYTPLNHSKQVNLKVPHYFTNLSYEAPRRYQAPHFSYGINATLHNLTSMPYNPYTGSGGSAFSHYRAYNRNLNPAFRPLTTAISSNQSTFNDVRFNYEVVVEDEEYFDYTDRYSNSSSYGTQNHTCQAPANKGFGKNGSNLITGKPSFHHFAYR